MHIVLVGRKSRLIPERGSALRYAHDLHLVEPLFQHDAQLKRSGMDYWQQVQWRRWPAWAGFHASLARGLALVQESSGPRLYSQASFEPEVTCVRSAKRPSA
jgi:tRNA(Leu) C34 or U34 (ribose-2'-O)-methylase TrmL